MRTRASRRAGARTLAAAGWLAAASVWLAAAGLAHAQATDAGDTAAQPPPPPERWAVHWQATDIFQYHPAFDSAFQGPQSFDHGNHTGNTFDFTLYFGVRLWRGAEFWVDPELNQGIAPNDTLGIAGYINADGAKVGKAHPYTRFQRVFLRQTFDLPAGKGAGDAAAQDPDENVLGGPKAANRVVVTLGKYNATDIFDTNAYAHDARRDFLNWSLVDAGSFDYAADAWGYSYGAAAEWYQGPWTARFGLFDLSTVPNNQHLTPDLTQFQAIAELEHDHTLFGRKGALRATAFVTRGNMGRYTDATAIALATGQPADIAAVRRYASRPGGLVNAEQEVADGVGVFARAGYDDGTLESYEFTDIDRTVQAGVSVNGARWGRKGDTVAIAGVRNEIASQHIAFLNAGGLGILIGDGRLPNPGAERIVEAYYKASLPRGVDATLDWQHIDNPAYNTDRGPADVLSLRLHVQR